MKLVRYYLTKRAHIVIQKATRHDICQIFYTTGVFEARILPQKVRKSRQWQIYDKTALMLQNDKFTTKTCKCFKITFMADIISSMKPKQELKKEKSGSSFLSLDVTRESLLLALVTKFHLKGACQSKKWIFLKERDIHNKWVNFLNYYTICQMFM